MKSRSLLRRLEDIQRHFGINRKDCLFESCGKANKATKNKDKEKKQKSDSSKSKRKKIILPKYLDDNIQSTFDKLSQFCYFRIWRKALGRIIMLKELSRINNKIRPKKHTKKRKTRSSSAKTKYRKPIYSNNIDISAYNTSNNNKEGINNNNIINHYSLIECNFEDEEYASERDDSDSEIEFITENRLSERQLSLVYRDQHVGSSVFSTTDHTGLIDEKLQISHLLEFSTNDICELYHDVSTGPDERFSKFAKLVFDPRGSPVRSSRATSPSLPSEKKGHNYHSEGVEKEKSTIEESVFKANDVIDNANNTSDILDKLVSQAQEILSKKSSSDSCDSFLMGEFSRTPPKTPELQPITYEPPNIDFSDDEEADRPQLPSLIYNDDDTNIDIVNDNNQRGSVITTPKINLNSKSVTPLASPGRSVFSSSPKIHTNKNGQSFSNKSTSPVNIKAGFKSQNNDDHFMSTPQPKVANNILMSPSKRKNINSLEIRHASSALDITRRVSRVTPFYSPKVVVQQETHTEHKGRHFSNEDIDEEVKNSISSVSSLQTISSSSSPQFNTEQSKLPKRPPSRVQNETPRNHLHTECHNLSNSGLYYRVQKVPSTKQEQPQRNIIPKVLEISHSYQNVATSTSSSSPDSPKPRKSILQPSNRNNSIKFTMDSRYIHEEASSENEKQSSDTSDPKQKPPSASEIRISTSGNIDEIITDHTDDLHNIVSPMISNSDEKHVSFESHSTISVTENSNEEEEEPDIQAYIDSFRGVIAVPDSSASSVVVNVDETDSESDLMEKMETLRRSIDTALQKTEEDITPILKKSPAKVPRAFEPNTSFELRLSRAGMNGK